jgi:hypothetical protein
MKCYNIDCINFGIEEENNCRIELDINDCEDNRSKRQMIEKHRAKIKKIEELK